MMSPILEGVKKYRVEVVEKVLQPCTVKTATV
jgi:hypothetical protein